MIFGQPDFILLIQKYVYSKDLNEYFINQDGGRFTLNGLATNFFIEITSETLSLRSRFVSVSYVGNVSQKCGCNNRWI